MTSKKHVFTQIEKRLFQDILKSYSAIVESKNTDSSTLRQKALAWEHITREYNASPRATAVISLKQLRRLWINLKQREAMAKKHQHRIAMRCGPSTGEASINPDLAQITQTIKSEIPGSFDLGTVFPTSLMTKDSNHSEISLNISQNPCTTDDLTLPPPPTIKNSPPPTATTPPPSLNTIPVPHTSGTTHPCPFTSCSPPLSIKTFASPTLQSSMSTSNASCQYAILEKEYKDRFNRACELHTMEKELLMYKIREAKAKAEFAELILQQVRQQDK